MAVSGLTAHGGRQGWLPDDLNLGRLDLFFLFLGGQPCMGRTAQVLDVTDRVRQPGCLQRASHVLLAVASMCSWPDALLTCSD